MQTALRTAIVATGLRYRTLADKANKHLPPGEELTELRLSQLVTSRREPTPAQSRALARVLRRKARDLFPKTERGAA